MQWVQRSSQGSLVPEARFRVQTQNLVADVEVIALEHAKHEQSAVQPSIIDGCPLRPSPCVCRSVERKGSSLSMATKQNARPKASR